MIGPILPFPSLDLHALPMWFLIAALFLPRVALLAALLHGDLRPFHLDWIASPVLGVLLPRVLVLALIYLDRGVEQWFLIHAVAGLFVFMGFHSPKAEVRDVSPIRTQRRRPGLPEWRL